MSSSKQEDDTLSQMLLSLTLVRSMAVPEKATESEVIFDNYSGDELLAGMAQMTTMMIYMEAGKAKISAEEYIENFRQYLLNFGVS